MEEIILKKTGTGIKHKVLTISIKDLSITL